jgi:hypothetical protein
MTSMEKFLNYRIPSTTHEFCSPPPWEGFEGCRNDTHDLFKNNLKTQPKDWIYRSKEISYSHNEQGFRENAFKDIDWGESIVIFGCSIVEGLGLALEDTIASQLNCMLKIPTVNLGIAGSAVDLAFFNSIILYNNYPRPKAVVHIWTSPHRYTEFSALPGKVPIENFEPTKPNYNSRVDWSKRSEFYITADRLIWKDTVPRFEGSFFEHSDKQIKNFKKIDFARDLQHPGILSAKEAATVISTELEGKIK